MNIAKVLKWVSAGYEGFLAIPILGGAFIVGFGYTPLVVAFILHLVTLIFAAKSGVGKAGSILGMITSIVGWIPLVGWFMHVVTFLTLLIGSIMDIVKSRR